jgi:hypothetical protein
MAVHLSLLVLRKRSFALLVAVMPSLVLTVLAVPAAAHDLGVRIPDGQNVDINYQNLTDNFRVATDWNINNNLHPTNLGTINVVVNSVRELNALDADYSPLEWSGLYECVDFDSSTGICRQGNIHYNQRYNHPETARRWLACHEFGHGLGIDHNLNGCMPAETYDADQFLQQHNVDHVNDWYRG